MVSKITNIRRSKKGDANHPCIYLDVIHNKKLRLFRLNLNVSRWMYENGSELSEDDRVSVLELLADETLKKYDK